jgi:DNA-binding MarR family transcriptional regulator
MAKLVRRFETEGLITRAVPEGDRRGMELRLTGAGDAFVQDHAQEFFDYAKSETDRLTPVEAEQLIALLQKYTGLGGQT